ncbi:MAG: type II 3-dehydroquinate dehydratase [Dichotomicrobium sp.]
MSKPVFILNGPNLNLLGEREPEIYGSETLEDIKQRLAASAADKGLTVDFRQSNREGELVDWIQEARTAASGLIINPAGYGHTSIAILDALLAAANIPCIEVHLSNIYTRETFRHRSLVSRAATGIICGFGSLGYDMALEAMAQRLRESTAP